jgi:FkbM family methyltransferase
MIINLPSFMDYWREHATRSRSQLPQDLFVTYFLKEKQNGFFVEFGATDGVLRSNTLLLEQEYGWKGILAEPARTWHEALRKNRTAAIDTRCVWSKSGKQLPFHEADTAELSTIKSFVESDGQSQWRAAGKTYPVETVSLEDLLKSHNAPKRIDYLSIDTEGSEFSILERFRFHRHDIKIITVEHNFRFNRNAIQKLLSDSDFIRVFEQISNFDDWYIHRSLL